MCNETSTKNAAKYFKWLAETKREGGGEEGEVGLEGRKEERERRWWEEDGEVGRWESQGMEEEVGEREMGGRRGWEREGMGRRRRGRGRRGRGGGNRRERRETGMERERMGKGEQ